MVLYDFSENYAYIIQDAAQAYHYNNDQCTVSPVVYYYCVGNKIMHKSLIFISDCLSHDTVAVHVVRSMLLEEIKKNVALKRIIYYSDGAKQRFKNCFQIANLMNHETDFRVPADWHFHVTTYGKNACDGIGATFKREATRASLQASSLNPLTNVNVLFEWAKKTSQQSRFVSITKKCTEELKGISKKDLQKQG